MINVPTLSNLRKEDPPLPAEIISILSVFAPLMSLPTWDKAQQLIIGAWICTGPRRVTSILRVLGLADEPRFEKYHRVLSRDKWSCALCAKILLGLLVALLPSGSPLIVAVDETIERRKGKKIRAKGCYRDAVRSTEKTVVKCFGLKWICMALIVPLPWSGRPWALPFLTVLAPSKKCNEERSRKHRTTVDWTVVMVRLVARWLKRPWILVGDGAYACIDLGHQCQRHAVTLISRLRLDVNLYDFPDPPTKGKRGRKPVKGKKLKKLSELAQDEDENQAWTESEVNWYGGVRKKVRYLTGINLWYKSGEAPLKIRWVLVINPDKPDRPEAFFSTDTDTLPVKVIEWFVLRWSIEVTFEEVRTHMGVETQRQWSDKAIGRTTPILMGLFSMACVVVNVMAQSNPLQPALAAWYDKKGQSTFSDVIAYIRRSIWSEKYFSKSGKKDEALKMKKSDLEILINQLSMAA